MENLEKMVSIMEFVDSYERESSTRSSLKMSREILWWIFDS